MATVVAPRAGVSISPDRHTAVIRAGAARDANDDGARGRRAEGPAREARLRRGAGQPHRRRRHVVRLQPGEQVGDAEVRADLVAGHARDPRPRVRLAGRRRAAADADDRRAGRRGRLAVDRHADRRHLDLGHELRADVRAGAGDRLRALHRLPLPRRLLRLEAVGRGGGRGDDGHRRQGRALLGRDGADLAERRDARAEPGVPVDEPRDHALGRLRAGGDADAAAGRAGEARRRGWTGSRSRGCTRASTARRGRPPGASVSGAVRCRYGLAALALLVALALPVLSLKTGMPSIKVVPAGDQLPGQGYDAVQKAFGPGATGPLQIVAPQAEAAQRSSGGAARSGRRAGAAAAAGRRRRGARTGDPDDRTRRPTRPARRSTVSARRCRRRRSSVVRWRRTTTSRRRCRPRRRW